MEIKPGIYSCGVQDPGLKIFDIIMHTPKGTSYNAYLVKGESKTALVETSKSPFWQEYLANVEKLQALSGIDYLIVNHTEPDHAGTIIKILEINPNIVVVGTNSAIQFVEHIVNRSFNSRVVKAGDTLDLGNRELRFYPMPNLHWPDTMFTYDVQTGALFTCDFFGAHYSYAPLLLSTMEAEEKKAYFEAQRKYFLDIMSPFKKPFVQNGVKCARELQPTIICTGHGPILDCDLEDIYHRNEVWADVPARTEKKVVVAFVSAYGYTRVLAETITETLKGLGRFDVRLIEVLEENKQQAMELLHDADGFLLGTPTILADALQPIWELTLSMHPVLMRGKAASAFGSYGWSGEGVPNIVERLKQCKLKTMDGLRVRFSPSETDLQSARDFALEFAQML